MNLAIVALTFMAVILNKAVSLQVLSQVRCASGLEIDPETRTYRYSIRRCLVQDPPYGVKVGIMLVVDNSSEACLRGAFALQNFSGRYYVRVHGGCDGLFDIVVKDNSTVHRPALNTDECGLANQPSGFRVVGGHQAMECQFPWMVFLDNRKYNKFCGSTILDSRHLLTAAHCVDTGLPGKISDASNFRFYAGTSQKGGAHRTTSYGAQKVFAHKDYQYNDFGIKNDIAVIRTTSPIRFDRCTRPICLASGDVNSATSCLTMGWGQTSNAKVNRTFPDVLLWTKEQVSHPSTCRLLYGRYRSLATFCGTGEGDSGICHGDSGGPFTCRNQTDGRYYQYGLMSAAQRYKCGVEPGLYTDVTHYWDWIKAAMTFD